MESAAGVWIMFGLIWVALALRRIASAIERHPTEAVTKTPPDTGEAS